MSLVDRARCLPVLEPEIGVAEDEGACKDVNEAGAAAARDDGVGADAGSGDVRRRFLGGGSESLRGEDKDGLDGPLVIIVSAGRTRSWAAGCDDAIINSLSREGRRRFLLAFTTGERGIIFARGSAGA